MIFFCFSLYNRDETLNTLRFAKNAKNVKTRGKVNEEKTRAQLKAEIAKLTNHNKNLESQLTAMRSELTAMEKISSVSTSNK